MEQIWLSPPHLYGNERSFIKDVLDSNWITTMGNAVNAFEDALQDFLETEKEIVALNSGTSAIHTALILAGVSKEDVVLCPTLTFVATLNPILYQNAIPVLVDAEKSTWGMCPILLEEAIIDLLNKGTKPKAILAVHVCGVPCQINRIQEIAKKYDIVLIEDAAAALGSKRNGQYCGTFGDFGIVSFNGNKIITTSSGGALVVNSSDQKDKAIYYASQAKVFTTSNSHEEVGYNYRMSNVLAAIGIAQLEKLPQILQLTMENYSFYKALFHKYSMSLQAQDSSTYSCPNYWLQTVLFQSTNTIDYNPKALRDFLKEKKIESRLLWRPLHTTALYQKYVHYLNGTSDYLYKHSLSLPSGSSLSMTQKEYIQLQLETFLEQ